MNIQLKLDYEILTKSEREAVAKCYEFYCIRTDIGWRPGKDYEQAAKALCYRVWFYEDRIIHYTYYLTTYGHDAYWKHLQRTKL